MIVSFRFIFHHYELQASHITCWFWYQRWRASLDELREADHDLFALEVVATRDQQLSEKEDIKKMEKEEEAIYDRLRQEGAAKGNIFLAKGGIPMLLSNARIEQIKAARTALAKETLNEQMKLKKIEEQEKQRALEGEREYMRSVWKEVEEDKRRTAQEAAIKNVEARRRMDEYALQTKKARDAEKEREKTQDKQLILNVLANEKKLAEKEAMEKALQMRQQYEFNEALKVEMALRAKSGEELARLEEEEAERQWQKRFAQWESEREARLALLREVYEDREKQVELHDRVRQRRREEAEYERQQIDADVEEFYKLAEERKDFEERARKEHAQTLARQIKEAREREEADQREIERELEEKRRRDAELAEAIAVEKERQKNIQREIYRHRELRRQEAAGGTGRRQ
ncbi:hypothetical protein FOL47_009137 [Perkinsus chesapeaki]|uniref:Cilia- and flagella-associated protein 53 n=1 Tax=Perkinsus chesapeaki TaxID=330153 RepID=A0A7J6LA69_PERCH|nr:hypothetical protein FOL47_009137 [Perkinsus chesapeaki]